MGNMYNDLSRQQLAEALTAANQRFDEALQSARHILYRLNVKKGGYDYLSPFFAELTGHSLAEFWQVTLDKLPGFFHPDDRQRIFGADGQIARAFQHRTGNQVHFLFEYRLRKADGSYCWLSDRNTAHFNAAGELEFFVGSAYDITEQKRAEEMLREKAAQLQVLFDSSQAGIILVDLAGRIKVANQRMAEMFGCSLDELIDSSYPSYIHPDQRSKGNDRMRMLLAGETDHVSTERHYIRKDGSDFWGHLSGRRHEDAEGNLISLVGHIIDITERKAAEEALLESELKFRTLFTTIQDAIFLTTAYDGRIFECNEKLSGYSREELIGKSSEELGLWADLGERHRVVELVSARGYVNDFEASFRRKDGTIFHGSISTNSFPLGDRTFLLSVVRDISDRKREENERLYLEKQLLHAQKLESLGVLAGGIAHDFNNILTAIIGNAELALMRLGPESPVLDNLRRIEIAAARAADLARQMLAYSGKGKFVVEAIDLNRLVEEMGHMLEVSISKKAILRYHLAKPLPAVEADATQLRQIVMNLVINASEAIGDRSGVIALTTGCIDCDESYLADAWLTDQIPAGLYVFLEIADTGCGMDRETRARIFDPFFTTKFTGRGLGMAAVLGIVRGHKGAIKIYSEPGKGSSFKILLPAGIRPAELFKVSTGTDTWHGSGVALLVDDEDTVRAIGSEMLRELGFQVLTASDGREALEQFKARNDIKVVILDLTMPHMDGEQCFRELRLLDPEVRVIMSSGFSEHEVTQKFAGKGLAGFVQKPYSLAALREAIKNT